MKKYWAELFGTYILVFVGTGAIMINEITGGDSKSSGSWALIWISGNGYDICNW